MKIGIAVGDYEKHVVEFEYNDFTGIARVTIDGVVVHKRFSLGIHKTVNVGDKEKHSVTINYGFKQFLHGGPVILIDGKPFLQEAGSPRQFLKQLSPNSSEFSKSNWRWGMDAKDYAVLAGGLLITAAVIAIADFLITKDFVIISIMAAGILPAGAAGLGMISAGGFFLTAKLLHRKMSLMAALLMIAILVPAYFGHYHVVYKRLNVETESGQIVPMANALSFWEFYKWDLTNRSYKYGHGTETEANSPVGKWGYMYGALELLGFLVGGIVVLMRTSNIRFCDACQKYFKTKVLARSENTSLAQQSKSLMEGGNEFSFLSHYPDWKNFPPRHAYGFYLELTYCKECVEGAIVALKLNDRGTVKTLSELPLTRESVLKLIQK